MSAEPADAAVPAGSPAPEWLDRLDRALDAGDHAILAFNVDDWVLGSDDVPLRLPEFLARHLRHRGMATLRWSLGAGVEPLTPPGVELPAGLGRLPHGRLPEEVLPGLTALLRSTTAHVAVLVDHAEGVVPAGSVLARDQQIALEVLHGWGLDAAIRQAGNGVLLISRQNQISDLLRRGGCGYRTVEIGLPTRDERRRALELIAQLGDGGYADLGRLAADTSAARLADASGGLRVDDLLKLAREAASRGYAVGERAILERKQETIRALGHDLIEVHEPAFGFEAVAGLAHVLDHLRACIAAERLPAGILLVGPPGVGKSFVAEALARELAWPLISLRSIREQWVGASERNLETVLWILHQLAPCVVRVEEIDQLLGQRSTGQSGDGGTSERLLARLWEFMGESVKGRRVLWVGTSNRPDLLDPATLDRFPLLLPFVHPTPGEVAALLPVLAGQLGRALAPDVDLAGVAATPKLALTTARSLRELLGMAAMWTDLDSGRAGAPIDRAHLAEAVWDARPNLDLPLHAFLALKAVEMTTFSSLLPWRGRHDRRDGAAVPPYLDGLIDGSGELDQDALRQRLGELEATLRQRRADRGLA